MGAIRQIVRREFREIQHPSGEYSVTRLITAFLSSRRQPVPHYQRKSEPLPDDARSWVDTADRYAHLGADPLQQATNMIGERIAAAMQGKSAKVVELPGRKR